MRWGFQIFPQLFAQEWILCNSVWFSLCPNCVQPLGKPLYIGEMNSFQGILQVLSATHMRYFKEWDLRNWNGDIYMPAFHKTAYFKFIWLRFSRHIWKVLEALLIQARFGIYTLILDFGLMRNVSEDSGYKRRERSGRFWTWKSRAYGEM